MQHQQNTQLQEPERTPTTGFPAGFDMAFLINRVKAVLLNPKHLWPQVKGENVSVQQMYMSYVLYLAAIPVVAQVIGRLLYGDWMPFGPRQPVGIGTALISGVFLFAVYLAGVYISSLIFQKVAAKFFETEPTIENTLKLVAYSSTPTYIAGVIYLLPSMGLQSLVSFIAGIYCLYVLYQGIPEMTGVAEKQRVKYLVVSLVASVIVYLVIGMVLGMIGIGLM